MISLSLSFRLWIPQVRNQPHGFFFSIQLDALHPPRWAASPPCCTWRRWSISLSSSAPLSTCICLQDPFDTTVLFLPLYMPIPSQPGLPYLIRDTHYSKDATDVIISFPIPQGKTWFMSPGSLSVIRYLCVVNLLRFVFSCIVCACML